LREADYCKNNKFEQIPLGNVIKKFDEKMYSGMRIHAIKNLLIIYNPHSSVFWLYINILEDIVPIKQYSIYSDAKNDWEEIDSIYSDPEGKRLFIRCCCINDMEKANVYEYDLQKCRRFRDYVESINSWEQAIFLARYFNDDVSLLVLKDNNLTNNNKLPTNLKFTWLDRIKLIFYRFWYNQNTEIIKNIIRSRGKFLFNRLTRP
jgi:hypothetical protein